MYGTLDNDVCVKVYFPDSTFIGLHSHKEELISSLAVGIDEVDDGRHISRPPSEKVSHLDFTFILDSMQWGSAYYIYKVLKPTFWCTYGFKIRGAILPRITTFRIDHGLKK